MRSCLDEGPSSGLTSQPHPTPTHNNKGLGTIPARELRLLNQGKSPFPCASTWGHSDSSSLPPTLPALHHPLKFSLTSPQSRTDNKPYKWFNKLVFLLRSNFHLHKCSSLETLPSLGLTAEAVPTLLCSTKRGESHPACCPPHAVFLESPGKG